LSFIAIAVDIPDSIKVSVISRYELPDNWQEAYPPEACRKLGSQWLEQAKTAVLAVPSAVIPDETNYILNPHHADFKQLTLHQALPFRFDGRLWR
jgi:RES domain-containing protein